MGGLQFGSAAGALILRNRDSHLKNRQQIEDQTGSAICSIGKITVYESSTSKYTEHKTACNKFNNTFKCTILR